MQMSNETGLDLLQYVWDKCNKGHHNMNNDLSQIFMRAGMNCPSANFQYVDKTVEVVDWIMQTGSPEMAILLIRDSYLSEDMLGRYIHFNWTNTPVLKEYIYKSESGEKDFDWNKVCVPKEHYSVSPAVARSGWTYEVEIPFGSKREFIIPEDIIEGGAVITPNIGYRETCTLLSYLRRKSMSIPVKFMDLSVLSDESNDYSLDDMTELEKDALCVNAIAGDWRLIGEDDFLEVMGNERIKKAMSWNWYMKQLRYKTKRFTSEVMDLLPVTWREGCSTFLTELSELPNEVQVKYWEAGIKEKPPIRLREFITSVGHSLGGDYAIHKYPCGCRLEYIVRDNTYISVNKTPTCGRALIDHLPRLEDR